MSIVKMLTVYRHSFQSHHDRRLTELSNTSWMGKDAAGVLDFSRVRAFLRQSSSVSNNLIANTTYQYARAGAITVGGELFTTEGSGRGPGGTTPWSEDGFFGTTAQWSGRVSAKVASFSGSTPLTLAEDGRAI
jgi:hypothetical protein